MPEATNKQIMTASEFDLSSVRPFGDSLNDGKIQLSFTLPVPDGDEAVEAAKLIIKRIGLHEPMVVHHKDLGEGFTFFIAYGVCKDFVDYTAINIPKATVSLLSKEEIKRQVENKLGGKLVVVGACSGTDAHTLGIDAILNMKGIDGHKGLESYPGFDVYNLGAQVDNEELLKQAIDHKADAILVSQVVTQKNVHITNLTELVDMLEAEGMREHVSLVVGGPRISHELAMELGYDAGFGPGSFAEHVASFLVEHVVARKLQA